MYAYGKIILFGEHAIVYGYPALAGALNVGIHCSFEKNEQSKFTLSIPQIGLEIDQNSQDSQDMLGQVLQLLERNLPKPHCYGRLVISAEIPFQAGLGSSAALAVAVICTLLAENNIQWPNQQINELAYLVETIFHGTPSGIDNTVATYGGLFFMADPTKSPMPECVQEKIQLKKIIAGKLPALTQPLSFVIINTKQKRETKKLVDHVRLQYHQNPETYSALFSEISQCTIDGYQMLLAQRYQELGNLLDRNHHLLQKLEVSSEVLDKAWQDAKSAGAYGAKLTGAGGGGCVIALAPDNATAVLEFLRNKGWECFSAKIL